MRGLGAFVNTVLCAVTGIVVAQVGVRILLTIFAVIMGSWISRNDGLGMATGLAIWFVARGIVAAIVPIVSAHVFARRWPVLGKWPGPAAVGAVLSVAVSMKWAAHELSINRFWP